MINRSLTFYFGWFMWVIWAYFETKYEPATSIETLKQNYMAEKTFYSVMSYKFKDSIVALFTLGNIILVAIDARETACPPPINKIFFIYSTLHQDN